MKRKALSNYAFTLGVTVLSIFLSATVALSQTSSFTYQGRLTDGGAAANGNYDLQFALWDSASGGTQIGSTQTISTVAISNGVFSVSLDFGASSFNGANRFLEISARPVSGGAFTLLSPRQQVTPTPYAIRSANASAADTANTATNATQLGGVAASQYVQTGDSRLSDARTPAPGSANYIQNTSGAQTANFNINGNGTVAGFLSGNVVNATTQYTLNGSSILSATPGSGSVNTALGFQTGSINSGFGNTMLGFNTGNANISGNENVFIGTSAGANNTAGGFNTFVGIGAGFFNTTGSNNAIFGGNTGVRVTTASSNSFFGGGAGADVTTGGQNTFIGADARGIITGTSNTFIGFSVQAPPGHSDLTNATAIGANAQVTASNSLVLGGINGMNSATADTNVGIGTTAPSNRLDVNVGNSALQDPGITIQGNTSPNGDIGLRIKNTNAGNEWYVDSTGTNSAYGVGNLAFAIRGSATAAMIIHPSGSIELSHLGTAGGTSLCLNGQSVIAACSSSLRYKINVASFSGGLNIINRLRPISFEWKQGGTKDIGLGAEEVEKVEPLLTFRNDKGEIEGVKYNQLSAVFINAIKEQQAQIEKQQQQLQVQQKQLEALKKLVCRSRRRAPLCR